MSKGESSELIIFVPGGEFCKGCSLIEINCGNYMCRYHKKILGDHVSDYLQDITKCPDCIQGIKDTAEILEGIE